MQQLATAVLILACLLQVVVCVQDSNIGKFIVVSDLHYGPELGSHPPSPLDVQYGEDSPLWLINSTVYAIADENIVKGPIDFILIAGDLISHTLSDLPSDQAAVYVKQSLTGIGTTFETVFENTTNNKYLTSPVMCVGNNDLYPKYAAPDTTQSFFESFASLWSSINNSPTAEQSFSQSGSFSIDVPIPTTNRSVRAVSVHTNYWSVKNIYTTQSDDPGGVFAFLQNELKQAEADKVGVYILGHIAPGMDHFAHTSLWQPRFVTKYRSIVEPYLGTTVLGQFYGHEHIALFRFLGEPDSSPIAATAGPLRLHSSISPVYGNNPSFRVYEYNRDTLEILDFSEWYLNFTNSNQPVWLQQYSSAKKLYHLSNLDTHSYCSFVQHMYENSTFFDEYYAESYAFATTPDCDNSCRIEYLCNAQFLDGNQYTDCINNDKRLNCANSPAVTTSTSTSTTTTSTISTSTTSTTSTATTSTSAYASTSTSSSTSSASATSTGAAATTGTSTTGSHHNYISRSHMIAGIVLIAAAVCIAVGMGAYFYIKRKKSAVRYEVLS